VSTVPTLSGAPAAVTSTSTRKPDSYRAVMDLEAMKAGLS